MTGSITELKLIISTVFLTIVIGASVAVLFTVIYSTVTKNRRTAVARMKPLEKTMTVTGNSKKGKKNKNSSRNDTGFAQQFVSKITDELAIAEIKVKTEEFLTIWLVCALVPAALILLFTKNAIPALAFFVIGAAGPIIFIKVKKNKRMQKFELQLSDALVICCNCLSSGLSFQQAMETIASDMPAPISTEFQRVLNEMSYGAPLDKALTDLVERTKSSDLMLVVSAVIIQRGTGGNLSEILETISETIKDRLKIKKEIRSVTAQGRMSSLIIGALPIVLGLLIMIINPDYMSFFFSTSNGMICLAVAALCEIIGFVLIQKIVTIKY